MSPIMQYHFTYLPSFKRDHLRQGDILNKTEELEEVLKQIHPHYKKDDYKHFMVLTQSCDLLRRNGKSCKAEYITLAAIRPFDKVLEKEVAKYQKDKIEQIGVICSTAKRPALFQFIEKVFNNNHPEYFYLHNVEEQGLPEPHCAFLRLSIALRSIEHYKKCLNAKFLELAEEFKAKLGWLVGNLYSRVGTMDWTPEWKSPLEFKSIINEVLERKLLWAEPDLLKAMKKEIKEKGVSIDDLRQEEIKAFADSIILPTKKEKKKSVLDAIRKVIEKSKAINEDVNIDKLLDRIEQDPVFSAHIK